MGSGFVYRWPEEQPAWILTHEWERWYNDYCHFEETWIIYNKAAAKTSVQWPPCFFWQWSNDAKICGIRTVSIACMIKLLEKMSVARIFASPTTEEPFPMLNGMSPPLAVVAFGLLTCWFALSTFEITWCFYMVISFSLFSGWSRSSTVSSGSFSNASSDRPSIVKGPFPERVLVSPTAFSTVLLSYVPQPARPDGNQMVRLKTRVSNP